MDYAVPDSDLVRFASEAARTWFDAVAAGSDVSILEHNSVLVRIGVMMDALARPDALGWRALAAAGSQDLWGSAGLGTGTAPASLGGYAAQIYHGPIVVAQGQPVPVVGSFPAPTDGDALKTWHALAQYARRLARFERVGAAGPAVPASGVLVATAGAINDAIVPLRGTTTPVFRIREDAGTTAVAPWVLAGAAQQAARGLAQARTGIVVGAGADEIAAAPILNTLHLEYEREGARGYMTAIGGLAVGVGAAVVGRYLAKPTLWRALSAGRSR